MKLLHFLLLSLLLTATLGWSPPAPAGPRVIALGTAQDGGMPQTGCDCSGVI